MVCKKCGEQNSKDNNFCNKCGAKLIIRTAKRGFASMDKDKQRLIASNAGKKAHQLGKAHTYSHEEAVAAGRKGGRNRIQKMK